MKMNRIFYFILVLIFQLKVFGQSSFELGIDSNDDCYVTDAAIDSDGNVLIIGVIGDFIEYDYDAYVLKVFPDGTYIDKRFNLIDTISVFTSISTLDNGNYFFVGSCGDDDNGQERKTLWTLILDNDLNIVISKYYTIREQYVGFGKSSRCVKDNDGNIFLSISALYNIQTYHSDFAFYHFNQEGDTLLNKYYECFLGAISYDLRKVPNTNRKIYSLQ